MYDSIPDDRENSVLVESLSRAGHKVNLKAAVAIVFIVVVGLVALSNNSETGKASSQKSTAAYLEAQSAVIAEGTQVLTKYAIKGVKSGAYITHSSNTWNVDSNIGIFGIDVNPVTQEEQWDFHYFNDVYGSYYKLKHSHDLTHWLTLQGAAPAGAASYNPTVLHAPKTIYDKEGFIRWNVTMNADGSAPVANTPQTGAGVSYYLVNVKRNRCLAIMYGLVKPTNASFDGLQNSVTSLAKDGSGNFPEDCMVEFLDASNAQPAGAGHGLWYRFW